MTSTININIKRLTEDAVIPTQAKFSDAGADLYSNDVSFSLMPGQRRLVPTGIALAIPEGYVGYIKPRSGLAHKHGIDVLGGVIDSGYRGEVGVILINHGMQPVLFTENDRIAQLVIQPVVAVGTAFVTTAELPESERGTGGFGSTGS